MTNGGPQRHRGEVILALAPRAAHEKLLIQTGGLLQHGAGDRNGVVVRQIPDHARWGIVEGCEAIRQIFSHLPVDVIEQLQHHTVEQLDLLLRIVGRLAQKQICRLSEDATPFPDRVTGQAIGQCDGWINQDVRHVR